MQRIGYLWLLIVTFWCSSATALQRTSGPELTRRDGLPNFFQKIDERDTLRVAYLGGSITAQPGWRVQSLEWFRHRFPNAAFSEIHAAIGGTGSDFGAFRLNEQVLKYNPDLVFVEFAVNDHRASEKKIIRSMESIVRQIRTHNPATEICFIYTTIESFLTKEQRGNVPASAIAMEKVADWYGIPSINFGTEVYRLVSKGKLIITGKEQETDGVSVFSRDGVHPYPETGHAIYTTVLKRCFERLADQKKSKDAIRVLPDPMIIDAYSRPHMMDIDEVNSNGRIEIIKLSEDTFFSRFRQFLTTLGKLTPGESLSFRFSGKAIGAYDFMGPGTGSLLVKLDGEVRDTISRFDAYCTYTRMNYFIIDHLEDKEHQVDITVLSDPIDKAAILAARGNVIDDPEKYKENNWYVGKILIDGDLLAPIPNPLRVSNVNPRYFTDNSGRAIYLTGSHTWDNLLDINDPDKETPFDYPAYLKFLKAHNHNFIRLWTWDLLNMCNKDNMSLHYVPLHPWERVGEENALDGKPRFDLDRLNEAYFDRLRERVQTAGKEGIYVSIMLFDGWGLQFSEKGYENHPFHPLNNINHLGLDTAEHTRLEIYQLANDRVTRIQERYIEKVIASVGDLDNVLYEISNENHAGSTEWQYHLIRYIKQQEKERGISHPVGMTYQHKGGTNAELFNSPADWISPNFQGGYKDNPPSATGQKVILLDTDHLWGIGGDRDWVWKSFLRGLNPIFMDPYEDMVFVMNRDDDWERARAAMGYTLGFANKIDLINMVPDESLATSGYCLASIGKEYLVYLPAQKETEIDLSGVNGAFEVSWFDTTTGRTESGGTIAGGKRITLTSPFEAAGSVIRVRLR